MHIICTFNRNDQLRTRPSNLHPYERALLRALFHFGYFLFWIVWKFNNNALAHNSLVACENKTKLAFSRIKRVSVSLRI